MVRHQFSKLTEKSIASSNLALCSCEDAPEAHLHIHSAVAQLVVCAIVNRKDSGSNPDGGAAYHIHSEYENAA